MGDMTLAQRFEFTLSFFRFAAIFLAEVGKEISKDQSPDTMALLQLSGAVPHEVGPFNVWGRGRGASVATARSSTPRPSSCPSPRPLDLVPEEEGEGLEGEGHGERYSPEDAAVSSGEYVTVVLDEEDAPAPDGSSLPGGADPSRGLSTRMRRRKQRSILMLQVKGTLLVWRVRVLDCRSLRSTPPQIGCDFFAARAPLRKWRWRSVRKVMDPHSCRWS